MNWSVFIIALLVFNVIEASYDLPPEYAGSIKRRSGAATLVHNDIIYTYGGEIYEHPYSNIFTTMELSDTGDIIYKNMSQQIPGPMCTVSNIILLPDNETMLLFVGRYVGYKVPDVLQIYSYQLSDPLASWVKIEPPYGTVWPPARKDYSATLAPNNNIYIYGGADMNTSTILNEMYSFDPSTNTFTDLTQNNLAYVNSHTATALPNGMIVYTSGRLGRVSTEGLGQVPSDQLLVYDTNHNTWETIQTGGVKFPERTNAGALLDQSQRYIFLFGGLYTTDDVQQELLNDLYVLDTTTWVWTQPNIKGFPPGPRNQASLAFLSNDLLLIAFGQAMTISRNDINILRFNIDSNDYTWLKDNADFTHQNEKKIDNGRKLSTDAIVGICFGGAFVILIIFCMFKWPDQMLGLPSLVYDSIIWTPRSGEPFWTELFRFSSRCIFLGLLAFYLTYAIREISDNTKATIVLKSASSTIQSPDIRFCYDGWNNSAGVSASNRPHIMCATDEGHSCMSYMSSIDMSLHQPAFSDRIGEVSCFLFSPPKSFNLVEDAGNQGLGTTLIFALYGNPDISGAIHTTIYPPGMDPNVALYGSTTTDIKQLMTSKQLNDWIVSDLDDRYAINVHSIYPKTVSTLSYQIQDHQYLLDTKWNKIGFLPKYNHVPEITTIYRPGVASDSIKTRGRYHLSTLRVFPNEYITMISQEKAISTVLSMVGSLGGVISLMAATQLLLFGFRPASPWGVVQRFAFGSLKASISQGLLKEFRYPYKSVPLVHDINHRNPNPSSDTVYSSNLDYNAQLLQDELPVETNTQSRFNRIEERIQLMERLLKAYYVDDEIFKEFDKAICRKPSNNTSSGGSIEGDDEAKMDTQRMRRRPLSEMK